MNDHIIDHPQDRADLQELERQIIAMGNMVESLFADCVMTLVDRGTGTMPELREHDYRAHESWLEIEKLCLSLLTSGELNADQVAFVAAVQKIAADLKQTADESLRIASRVRSCGLRAPAPAESLSDLPRMVELTQSMLSETLEAFINRDAAEAGGQHLVARQIGALGAGVVAGLAEAMEERQVPIPVGIAYADVACRLERIGQAALNISNQVGHLSRDAGAV